MADALDIEAKKRGVSREAFVAYLMKQRQMTGQNGTQGAPQPSQPQRPAPPPQPRPDNRSALQRLLDALGGNPSGN